MIRLLVYLITQTGKSCEETKRKMYKISVIVPVYNTQKFLASCLDSILAQSIKGLELIIVNDASKDNSAQIIKEYADKYKNIVVINHEKNKGLYQARISGIKAANGEYLAFVDSDDTVSVDWFRMLVKKADEENADMVVGNTINVFEDGNQNYFSIYRSLTHNRPLLTGDEIFNIFLEQEGECFLWHTV
ncbi:MAG TPA: glycosyltransferase family 2 protein [Clostridia bacterium]|nr:glycosyltransferase family 2 protein [Clostridia bacterium]